MLSLSRLRELLLDTLFPAICVNCKAPLTENKDQGICASCLDSLSPPDAFTCPICRGRIPISDKKLPAIRSRCHPEAGYILLSCSLYGHPTTEPLIKDLKFGRQAGIAQALGTIATRAVQTISLPGALVVPIPLSAQRLRERGFNQAGLIATEICRQTNFIISEDLLTRTKTTKPQTSLTDWGQRAANLRNAFAVTKKITSGRQPIILVDDVWTSGATMNAAVHALRSNGAHNIIGVVIGRSQ